MTDLVPSPSYGSNAALVTFLIYTLGVLFLAWMSNRLRKTKSFLSEYFLGSRSLGVWAFALTFAATSASGGSFTGFPSKIYTHGWILGLWIGSYIVVPICGMGLLGNESIRSPAGRGPSPSPTSFATGSRARDSDCCAPS